MFYEVLQEKKAAAGEGNYHSRYLSEGQRLKAFDRANERRAGRKQGLHGSRNFGGVAGGVVGGLTGGALSGPSVGKRLLGGAAGALVGGGLGYGLGSLGDSARDDRTREAQGILKMPPKARRDLLDVKRARLLEAEDRMKQMEERAHRAQMQRDIRDLKSRPTR